MQLTSRSPLLFLLLATGLPMWAHAVSMSTGELFVDGPTAEFELRIPMYEVAHVEDPEVTLLDQIRFGQGHRTKSSCAQEEDMYVCRASYEFPTLIPESLQAECTLARVTVPNHVHVLTAVQGPNQDQAVFDQSFTRAEVRFRPLTRAEIVVRNLFAGAGKSLATVAGVLVLFALAWAARTPLEAVALGVTFLAGEWLAQPLATVVPLGLSERFLGATAALIAAYLAVEVLLLPEGRARWLVALGPGVCLGLSMAAFPLPYLVGASAAQAVCVALLAAGALALPPFWRRPGAVALLVAGLAWFGYRVVR